MRLGVLLLFSVALVRSAPDHETDEWVLHVAGGKHAADAVAADFDLDNLGEVVPETNIFHFRASSSSSSRRRRRSAPPASELSSHPDVSWAESHSAVLVRTKRVPLPEVEDEAEDAERVRRQAPVRQIPVVQQRAGEVCFVNTVSSATKDARRCIFPFAFKGRTYTRCTRDHSSNGAEWCATEVKPDGEVVTGQWGDCDLASNSCFLLKPTAPNSNLLPHPPPPPPQAAPPARTSAIPPARPPTIDPEGPSAANSNGGSGGGFNPFLFFFNAPPQRQGPVDLVENNDVPPAKDVPEVNVSQLKTYLTDPAWPKMWFLNRGDLEKSPPGMDMNVEDAWAQGYTGKNITVVILDDGVELTHPDLAANYDPEASIDLNDNDDDPTPRYDLTNSNRHGTRCAGTVAAAANNSECAVGIAYDGKVGGIRILDGQIMDALEARALSFKRQHIDIYSASWGPDDNGATVDGPGPLTRLAMEEGIAKGRGGLGSIYVWASGNGGKFLDSCNADGYTTSIYTLSVSSASENGLIPWYSEQCSSSMATTYSSGATKLGERKVVTTDLHGACTDSHTGTSASSPMAAAMVALALEANPGLTWRDVQHLVVRTARPEGNLKAADWASNGVGRRFSHAFGFGLMDAGAITRLAKNWTTVPAKSNCSTSAGATLRSGPVVIGPRREELVRLQASDCAHVKFLEHVQLRVDVRATSARGSLSVRLKSPSQTVSVMLANRPFDQRPDGLDQFANWPMMSVHFWGEPSTTASDSEWTLLVRNDGDRAATLNDATITFHGTQEDPQPAAPGQSTPAPPTEPAPPTQTVEKEDAPEEEDEKSTEESTAEELDTTTTASEAS